MELVKQDGNKRKGEGEEVAKHKNKGSLLA